jgi:hypothetical protein
MISTKTLRACSLALAALCLHGPAWASDQPSARKSSQFPVTVTVVHSTANPQAPVAQVECHVDGGQTSCTSKEQTVSSGAQCTATEAATWCWY